MATTADSDARIPFICADKSSVAGAEIFNPNSWSGESKGVVQSCWTECSVLHHCVGQIVGICNDSELLCQAYIKMIQQQWCSKKFDLRKVIIFGQHTDLHIQIEAFLSGVKTLLDLLVQLLSSEKIVSGVVDGFHRQKNVYGGKVLNSLANNALSNRKEAAAKVGAIISEHKTLWIDQAILARDQLIHPQKGIHQLMFHLELTEKAGDLVCVKVNSPEIDSVPIDKYAQRILKHACDFSSSFLGLIREIAVSKNGMEPTC